MEEGKGEPHGLAEVRAALTVSRYQSLPFPTITWQVRERKQVL